ncbi:MAG: TonB-dependent receptor [Bacteroidetes bacterium]|nr:TonB-dependent receptor [Bacteroidota bacterium]
MAQGASNSNDEAYKIFQEKVNALNPSEANVYGHVLCKSTGKHISKASVRIVGTTIGTLTDMTGHYILAHLPVGELTISVRVLGYKTEEIKITAEKNKSIEVDFQLEQQAILLDQVVVSATRTETSKKETATIVNVVGVPTFENTSSATISEGIVYQPGVRVEYNCGNCGVPQLVINGLQGEYSQVLLNSRPIFSSLSAVYNLEQLPTSMVDRIEVIRGGGSALFGSNAVAGVVNIITKEPHYNSSNVNTTLNLYGNGLTDKQLSFGGSFVSSDYTKSIYLYGGTRYKSQYDRNGDGFSDIPKLHNDNFGFRAIVRPTDFSKLTTEYYHMSEFRRGGNKMNLQPFRTDITEQLEHDINGASISYDLFSSNQLHYISTYIAGQWIVRDSYFGTDGDLDCFGNTKDLTTVAGTQYQFKSNFPLLLPFEFTSGLEWTHNKINDTIPCYNRSINQEANVVGLYLQNEWKSEELNFVLGARLDKHNFIDGIIINPRASIRYSPNEHIGLRGSYARGYRAPQTYNEDLHIGAVGGEVSLISNSLDLKPEYSNSISISADLYKNFSHDLQTNLLIEGFYTNLNDIFALVEKGKDEAGNLLLERINASGAVVKGFNIEGIIGIIDFGDLQLGVTIQQSRYKEPHQWTDEPTLEPQKKMFRSPDFYGYFTATKNIFEDFKISLFGKYTGTMLVQHFAGYIEKDTEVTTPAFFDMGFKLSYSFYLPNSKAMKYNLGLGIKNIFDSYQKDLDVGPLKDAGFIYGPLMPRTFFIELKFDIM